MVKKISRKMPDFYKFSSRIPSKDFAKSKASRHFEHLGPSWLTVSAQAASPNQKSRKWLPKRVWHVAVVAQRHRATAS
jgi:hypothetical protein